MKLYSVTLPGLDVRSDWRTVHDRLLDDFPAIEDVLAAGGLPVPEAPEEAQPIAIPNPDQSGDVGHRG